ncbi:MAG: glycosyltransferase family 4 protein, partial [Flavobacteriales bacterium]|nr:glycosyltransferase family 4 protein [Flavobacteriales bacterium]
MQNKENIIFVTPFMSSFIESDISILASEYNVIINTYDWKNKTLSPFFLLRQLFFLLFNISKSKSILVEFGGYWSVLPSILGKIFKTPIYIVLHGTDCASIPELNYGSMRIPLLKKACEISYRNATKLLPVSESLVSVENNFQRDLPSKQGYKNFFPDIETDYKVLYNGIDEDYWKIESGASKEEKTFLAVFSEDQFYLKGGGLIFEVADRFKECKFRIVGVSSDKHENVPCNVELLGRLSLEELKEQYQKSQFYFQLSVIEGFGVALCEAMLCGCIPIGSSVNMIPEIIGDTGFVLKEKDVNSLQVVIEQALSIEDKV